MKKTLSNTFRLSWIILLAILLTCVNPALIRADTNPLAASTTTAPANAAGAENPVGKDETIYGLLDLDGRISRVDIVNHLYGEAGSWVDYGTYTEIINLTDQRQPEISGDAVRWDAADGADLYYQGRSELGLPWKITLTWQLDGQPVEPATLGGSSGVIDLHIQIEPADGTHTDFTEHFLLQITVPLDMGKAGNITAAGSTIVVAGRTKTLSYSVLPGQSADFDLSFTASELTMDPIQITAMLYSLTQTGLDQLIDGIEQLETGLQQTADGNETLAAGLTELSTGLAELAAGLSQVDQSSPALLTGMQAYLDGLNAYVTQLQVLAAGSTAFAAGLDTFADQGQTILQGYGQLYLQMSGMKLSEAQILELQQILAMPDDPANPSLSSLKAMASQLLQLNGGIGALSDGLNSLNTGLGDYVDGATALAAQYAQLHAGISQLPAGGSELAAGFADLRQGTRTLLNALPDLSAGLQSTADQVEGMPAAVDKLVTAQRNMAQALAEILTAVNAMQPDGQYQVGSFAAPGQIQPASVQFLMRTPGIDLPGKQEESSVDEDADNRNIFERLADLFR